MNKVCGRSAAAPLISVAIAARLVWLLSVEYREAFNASWMSPLLGFVLYIPVGLAIKSHDDTSKPSSVGRMHPANCTLLIIVTGTMVLEAAACIRLMSITANITALGEVPVWLFALPVTGLIFLCCRIGMEAAGYSASIWIKIAIPLIIVMMVLQLRSYQTAWITPIFGGGLAAVLNGALRCAGVISLYSLPWLNCVEDRNHSGPIRCALWGMLAASFILIMLAMLTPPMVFSAQSKIASIEMLLNNGRLHLSIQLITVILWFGSLLHLLNMLCNSAQSALNSIVPKPSKWLFPAVIALIAGIAAVLFNELCDSLLRLYGQFLYPAICSLLIVSMISKIIARKRETV